MKFMDYICARKIKLSILFYFFSCKKTCLALTFAANILKMTKLKLN